MVEPRTNSSPEVLPSAGARLPLSSMTLRSTPNMRRPCLALSLARSIGASFCSSGRNTVSVPTGLISVMPQPCVTSMS